MVEVMTRDSCISNVCSEGGGGLWGWGDGGGNHFVNMDTGLSSYQHTHADWRHPTAIFRSAKGGILHIQHF